MLTRLFALLAVAVTAMLPAGVQAQGSNRFEFVALGDMPYRLPDDFAAFDRLIAAINATRPSFSLHVGDIKNGSSPCSDEHFAQVLQRFRAFDQPLVYTIGDNEWTDCHRQSAGGHDPLERLDKLRRLFFAAPEVSLGKQTMPVEAQSRAMADKHAPFVENARFEKNGVWFSTVHVVGSNNGFEPGDPRVVTEFTARDAANVAWIDDTFRKAQAANARAVVIAWQANVHDTRQMAGEALPRSSGFVKTIEAVERGATAFKRPVLIVYGDGHEFEVVRFRNANMKHIPGALALQVMGEARVHAVRVLVDPDSPGVFGFVPLLVPENGPH